MGILSTSFVLPHYLVVHVTKKYAPFRYDTVELENELRNTIISEDSRIVYKLSTITIGGKSIYFLWFEKMHNLLFRWII